MIYLFSMRLTMQSDFAFRTLIYLAAKPQELASAKEVAEAYGISTHHLAKVAQKLQRAGFVHSVRGAQGGMRLARPAQEIMLGTVVRCMESESPLVECFDMPSNTCPIVAACGLKRILHNAYTAFVAHLDQFSVADAVGKTGVVSRLLTPIPLRRTSREQAQ